MNLPKVLLVEDDPMISKAISQNFVLSGFGISIAENASQAKSKLSADSYDVLLLDINLPDSNGLELFHEIRATGIEAPILFISARADEEIVVKAMNIGAEDYIRKPFGMEELKVRIARALRRPLPTKKFLTFGSLVLDIGLRQATLENQAVALSRREFDILTVLATKAGDVATRDSLALYLNENSDVYDRTIDSHVSHLRKKLLEAGGGSIQIIAVYGVGYRLTWKE